MIADIFSHLAYSPITQALGDSARKTTEFSTKGLATDSLDKRDTINPNLVQGELAKRHMVAIKILGKKTTKAWEKLFKEVNDSFTAIFKELKTKKSGLGFGGRSRSGFGFGRLPFIGGTAAALASLPAIQLETPVPNKSGAQPAPTTPPKKPPESPILQPKPSPIIAKDTLEKGEDEKKIEQLPAKPGDVIPQEKITLEVTDLYHQIFSTILDLFKTDVFVPLIEGIKKLLKSKKDDEKSQTSAIQNPNIPTAVEPAPVTASPENDSAASTPQSGMHDISGSMADISWARQPLVSATGLGGNSLTDAISQISGGRGGIGGMLGSMLGRGGIGGMLGSMLSGGRGGIGGMLGSLFGGIGNLGRPEFRINEKKEKPSAQPTILPKTKHVPSLPATESPKSPVPLPTAITPEPTIVPPSVPVAIPKRFREGPLGSGGGRGVFSGGGTELNGDLGRSRFMSSPPGSGGGRGVFSVNPSPSKMPSGGESPLAPSGESPLAISNISPVSMVSPITPQSINPPRMIPDEKTTKTIAPPTTPPAALLANIANMNSGPSSKGRFEMTTNSIGFATIKW